MGRRDRDVDAAALAGEAGAPEHVVRRALDEAEQAPAARQAVDDLVALLAAPPDQRPGPGELGRTALRLLVGGPQLFACALVHGYAARPDEQSELVDLALSSGRLALSAGDHESARLLLQGALDLDGAERLADRPAILLDLARAVDGCGDLAGARDVLSECIRLARAAGDDAVVIDAAVRSAFPADWRAGDRRRTALLAVAEEVDDGTRSAAILGARAMVEMRIPQPGDPDQQIAWVTRPGVAQPLAERALALSETGPQADRLVALLAWRSTHRGPGDLARRLEVSAEAVDLAQRLLDHDRLVDAAVAAAVDRLEAGDRSGYDRALTTVQWAARADGNPRLRWWAATMSAGVAVMDGDLERAGRARAEADDLGRRHGLPGWVAAELLLAAEMAVASDDDAELRPFRVEVDSPVLASPIARATVAFVCARLGLPDEARQHARLVRRALDDEASYLLCLTLLARAAVLVDDPELVDELHGLLAPFAAHVAVDASGWWCQGPVSLALAELAVAGGRSPHTSLGEAERAVEAIGDVVSQRRLAHLLRAVAVADGPMARPGPPTVPGLDLLSERERSVLVLVAKGRTNAAIAAELAYSPSTIRADTVSIYRKLRVGGRAEAAALAVVAGLSDPNA